MSENNDLPEEIPKKTNPENDSAPGPKPATGNINEITIPETTPQQKTKEMEVHHHGHVHEKKKWKEYVFQFFMLFAAVFLGSFAETKREDIGERHKEREYMESMVADIKKDSIEINYRYSSIFTQIQKIDSLQILFTHNLENNTNEVLQCYNLSNYLLYYHTVTFNERTISQLISSGNMRLIKRKGAADKIMEYYDYIKTINQQKQQSIIYINLTIGAMYRVFDVSYLRKNLNTENYKLEYVNPAPLNIHLRRTDPDALKEFSGTLENTKFVIDNYREHLGAISYMAAELISFLQGEYNLKNE